MECEGHVTSRATHVGACECTSSAEMSPLSRSTKSEGGSLCMKIVSSFVDGMSGITDDSGLKHIGEVKKLMFKTYSDPPTTHMQFYEWL